jgi:hypothetical protein
MSSTAKMNLDGKQVVDISGQGLTYPPAVQPSRSDDSSLIVEDGVPAAG